MSERSVVEVLGYGTDEHGPIRRVRYDDGSIGVQHGTVTAVAGTITRADGTVEPGGQVTDIRVGG